MIIYAFVKVPVFDRGKNFINLIVELEFKNEKVTFNYCPWLFGSREISVYDLKELKLGDKIDISGVKEIAKGVEILDSKGLVIGFFIEEHYTGFNLSNILSVR